MMKRLLYLLLAFCLLTGCAAQTKTADSAVKSESNVQETATSSEEQQMPQENVDISEDTTHQQEVIDCTPEGLLQISMDGLTIEQMEASLTEQGWKEYTMVGLSENERLWLVKAFDRTASLTLTFDENHVITAFIWSQYVLPSSMEEEVKSAVAQMQENEWRDSRATAFYDENVKSAVTVMAEWILTGRALLDEAGGGDWPDGAMRLTPESQEQLESLFEEALSADEKITGVQFGEQYAQMQDGTFLGYRVSGGPSGNIVRTLMRCAENYQTSSGAQPQYYVYDPCQDVPLTTTKSQ